MKRSEKPDPVTIIVTMRLVQAESIAEGHVYRHTYRDGIAEFSKALEIALTPATQEAGGDG